MSWIVHMTDTPMKGPHGNNQQQMSWTNQSIAILMRPVTEFVLQCTTYWLMTISYDETSGLNKSLESTKQPTIKQPDIRCENFERATRNFRGFGMKVFWKRKQFHDFTNKLQFSGFAHDRRRFGTLTNVNIGNTTAFISHLGHVPHQTRNSDVVLSLRSVGAPWQRRREPNSDVCCRIKSSFCVFCIIWSVKSGKIHDQFNWTNYMKSDVFSCKLTVEYLINLLNFMSIGQISWISQTSVHQPSMPSWSVSVNQLQTSIDASFDDRLFDVDSVCKHLRHIYIKWVEIDHHQLIQQTNLSLPPTANHSTTKDQSRFLIVKCDIDWLIVYLNIESACFRLHDLVLLYHAHQSVNHSLHTYLSNPYHQPVN